jgi:hypothetical protein
MMSRWPYCARRTRAMPANYEHRLAVELAAMLPDDREQAKRVLAYVGAILSLTVGETEEERFRE